MIQFVGRDAYKQFWNFSKDEKENLATQLAIELPALRGKVGASQEEIASAVGISRQTYSAYENRTRPIPWSLYLALLFYFDYIPSTHYMIRQLELFPNERSYGNKTYRSGSLRLGEGLAGAAFSAACASFSMTDSRFGESSLSS